MTTVSESILRSLKDISKTSKLRKRGNYITAHATFALEKFVDVLDKINAVVMPILKNGEKIESDISSGKIVDCGLEQFKIIKGKFLEVYDYGSTTAIFIRLYHVKGDKEWLALYVDENPDTPWWGEKE